MLTDFEIGTIVWRERQRRNWSQDRLAAAVNGRDGLMRWTGRLVSNVERGERPLKAREIIVLIDVFDFHVELSTKPVEVWTS